MFLKDSLVGKQPGLGNIRLSSEEPSQNVLDVFQTRVVPSKDYTLVVIDTRAFENGGTLTVDIEVGRADANGFFYLFDGNRELPTALQISKEDRLASVWIEPGDTRQITHSFERGQFFKLGAIGRSDEERGQVNAFQARISVEEN